MHKKVKIQIDDIYWIFDDALSADMYEAMPNRPVPYNFQLKIDTLDLPIVYRKIQDGNVTEYEKLS